MLDPNRCALLIIDVQNDFCHPDGVIERRGLDASPARAALPAINTALAAARALDVPRIYFQVEHDEWTDDPAWLARSAASRSMDEEHLPLARTGTWGAELYELAPQPDELVIHKPRHSGFAYTALALALRAKHRDTIVLAGVETNVCVLATAVDGLAQGFHPVLLTDATAATSLAEHETTVASFPKFYGPAVSSADLVRAWQPEPVQALS